MLAAGSRNGKPPQDGLAGEAGAAAELTTEAEATRVRLEEERKGNVAQQPFTGLCVVKLGLAADMCIHPIRRPKCRASVISKRKKKVQSPCLFSFMFL